MSVGPHRRTSALGDMLGRVGRIAGQAVAGGVTQEQRRIPPPRSSPPLLESTAGLLLMEQIELTTPATQHIFTSSGLPATGPWVVMSYAAFLNSPGGDTLRAGGAYLPLFEGMSTVGQQVIAAADWEIIRHYPFPVPFEWSTPATGFLIVYAQG